MEIAILALMANELRCLGVNYEYREYTKKLAYPYCVGELSEDDYSYENGNTATTFFLTAFSRNDVDLIEMKQLVKKHFADFRRRVGADGTVWISYSNSLFLESAVESIAKMEIYLEIKYWESE